jgi:dipeptidyl aminopeptidase/acylaminoacyl peptidase
MSRAAVRHAALFLTFSALPVFAQSQKTLTWQDAGRFEALGASTLSADGRWIAYDIRRSNADLELRFRMTSPNDSTRVVKQGGQSVFSGDGKWIAFPITYTEAERARMQKANQPIRDKLGLIGLSNTAKRTTIDDVQSFAFNYSGSHLAYRRFAPTGRKSRGADLVVRDLGTGIETTLGNVAEFAWQERGSLLALALDAEAPAVNGVQLYDPANGSLRTLDSREAGKYSGLTWRRKADDLVVLRARVDSAFNDTAQVVLAWKGLSTVKPQHITYEGSQDVRVVSFRRPRWSEDGSFLVLGVKAREPKLLAKASGDSVKRADDEKPEVEVWHTRDSRPQMVQKLRLTQEQQANDIAVLHISDTRLVRLSSGKPENVIIFDQQKIALDTDDKPYESDGWYGRPWRDLSRLDVMTGARQPLATKIPFGGSVSAGGRYVTYVKDEQWWSIDLTTGATHKLTANVPTKVVDVDDDHPAHHRSAYGIAGWTPTDRSVIVYDKYDLWEITPDGSKATRLTQGAEEGTIHRYVRLDPEQTTIDLTKPIYLTLFGDRSKKGGLARRTPKGVERLTIGDESVTRLMKARDAEVYAYVEQSYVDSPDILVGGPLLTDAHQVSNSNAFQKDFAWGKAELIEFNNGRGEKTQAILNYPANYDPSKKYPMVVYIYERLTNGLHQYVVPSERSQYNVTNFTQHGYFVLRPDITYVPREPGAGTIGGVVPAIKKVVEMGLVDEKRVGVMGHSWGGYGTAYLATHTKNVFAAAVAGAALTNLVSFYGYSSENSGFPEHGHFEVGQERMQVSLWEDPDAYVRNSPIFTVHEMTTPLLIEHGDKDGNVDFGQGVELYNAARRNGKNVVMIVYNGENHGLAKKPNQIDYARKQLEWFGHYLKGEPAPKWITDGVPYIERSKQ